MEPSLRTAAILIGVIGLFIYYRSIIRVMLINRRERDCIERGARFAAVSIIHGLARKRKEFDRVQPLLAWTLPLFVLFAVATWFLLVQVSFAFILWGLGVKEGWAHAFAASGSALSTLGFSTPPSLLGEYLAIFEAAIGLAIVVLLFTFVPSYQAAIQLRERKVGWIFARTGGHPSCMSLLQTLKNSNRLDDRSVWEDWEAWFRGVIETHSTSPILAYIPSIYPRTNWVDAAAAVLDTTSLLVGALDSKHTQAMRICREMGVRAVRQLATELNRDIPVESGSGDSSQVRLADNFDRLYDELVETGLPLKVDRDKCRDAFSTLRAEYEGSIHHISRSTLMPVEEPWSTGTWSQASS